MDQSSYHGFRRFIAVLRIQQIVTYRMLSKNIISFTNRCKLILFETNINYSNRSCRIQCFLFMILEAFNWPLGNGNTARMTECIPGPCCHYRQVAWALRHLKSPTPWQFVQELVQVNNKNIQEPDHWSLVREIDWWSMDSPGRGPVMQEAFPCHDVFIAGH